MSASVARDSKPPEGVDSVTQSYQQLLIAAEIGLNIGDSASMNVLKERIQSFLITCQRFPHRESSADLDSYSDKIDKPVIECLSRMTELRSSERSLSALRAFIPFVTERKNLLNKVTQTLS